MTQAERRLAKIAARVESYARGNYIDIYDTEQEIAELEKELEEENDRQDNPNSGE